MATESVPYMSLRQNIPTALKSYIWKCNLQYQGKWKKYQKLKKWHNLSVNNAAILQSTRLETIVDHAISTVPYYKKNFEDEDIDKNSFNISRFTDLPILTKSDLRSNYDDLKTEKIDQYEDYENRSGGSTGQPVRLRQHTEYTYWNLASKHLFDEWAGRKPGQPRIKLWGSERDITNANSSIRGTIGRIIENTIVLDCFTMDKRTMSQYVSWIDQLRPKLILAYVDGIFQLAQFIEREGYNVHSPNGIMTSAGTLLPEMRKKIESAFGCSVYNRYGTREVGDIACEREPGAGLRVNFPLHYLEVVDEVGDPVQEGEEGRILITSLTNYAMPLIRYEIGDLAIPSEIVSNEIPHVLRLDTISGRIGDALVTDDGKIISTAYFIHSIGVLLQADWIEMFQVVQHKRDQVEILIVPAGEEGLDTHKGDLAEIRSSIYEVMGESCSVDLTRVADIDGSDSGKYRYTISHVN